MNEKRGSHRWLWLLLPAAFIIAKHHHGPMGRRRERGQLPPRLEAMLKAWHDRAHAPADPSADSSAPEATATA